MGSSPSRWARLTLLLLLPLALPAGSRAAWIELPAAADAGILEYVPGFNLGAQTDVPAGTLGPNANNARSRMLLRFDLASAMPTNAVIEAAFLRLTVSREPLGAAASRFALHRVLAAWSEGDQQGAIPGGAPASPGEVTWNDRRHGQAAWSAPGGILGVDFDPQPAATERIEQKGPYEFEFGAKGLAELQHWLEVPSTNHGWILRSEAEDLTKTARRFATRESQAGPVLAIRYTAVPAAPRITRFELRGREMVLRFWGAAGQGYVCESAVHSPGAVWHTVAQFEPIASAGERTWTNLWPALPEQYFRLRTDAPD